MVFKSIDDTVNKVKNAISTIDALKASASNESTFTFDEKFDTTLNKDVEALELYQKALHDEKSEVEAMASSFKEASASARTYAETHREINIEDFKNQQRAAQVETAAQNHTLANSKVIIDEYNAILTDSAHAQEANYQALSKTKLSQTEYLEAVGKSNPELKKYLSSLKQADGTTKGYVGSLILAKAATIGLKTVTLAFKTVINSIIGMGIGALVQLALSGIQKIIEAVKEAHKTTEEKLAEIDKRLSETGSTVKQIVNDFRSLKQSADEVIPRFVELAAGVDEFGKNAKLTDKEYEEFISLNNKIAEMFPELNLGMDSNYNAMLSLSYSADTLKESLEALLEVQRQEANQQTASKLPEILDDVKKYEDETNDAINNIRSNINKIQSGSFTRTIFGNENSAIADAKSVEEFYDYVEYLTSKGIEVTTNVENIIGTASMTYTATWDKAATQATNAVAGLNLEIDNLENTIKSKWKSINPYISAWLQSDFLYLDMSDEMQDATIEVMRDFEPLDLGLLGENGEETAENIKSYITKFIINPLYSASPEVKDAVKHLFVSDGKELSINEFESLANKIKEQFGEDNPVYLYVKTNLDNADEMANTVKSFIKDEFDSSVDELSLDDLAIAASDEFWKFLNVPDGTLLSLDELNKKLKEYNELSESGVNSLSSGLDELDNVTDATRNATVAILEQKGVSNAAAIVDEQLAVNKEKVSYASIDLSETTANEVKQLFAEMNASDAAKTAIAQLWLEQLNLNNISIDLNSNIDQIINLANAAGASASAIVALSSALDIIKTVEVDNNKNGIFSRGEYERAKDIINSIGNGTFDFGFNILNSSNFKSGVYYSGGSGSSGSSGSSKSSSSGDNETWFESQYNLHKHLLAMEQERDIDYYNWLSSAYKKAYKEGIITLDDYRKYQEEVFGLTRNLFEDSVKDIEHEISVLGGTDYKKIVSLYKNLISAVENEISKSRKNGLNDTDDYIQSLSDKLQSYKKSIEDIENDIIKNAKDALDDLIDYRINIIKKDIENEKDSLSEKLSALKDFYEEQKDMLRDVADEEKYLEEQKEKRKSVTDIQEQIYQLEYDSSAWAQKRKLELANDLAKAEKELSDFEKDHAIDVTINALDDEYEMQERLINSQIKSLEDSLDNPSRLYNQALRDIKNNTSDLYSAMIQYNRRYGSGSDKDITETFNRDKENINKYKEYFGEKFNGVYIGSDSSTAYETSDARRAIRIAVGLEKATDQDLMWLDIDGDGKVTTADARAILRASVGLPYASGTTNASPGWHKINENGEESIFKSSDGSTYRMFYGGEKVLDAKSTEFLYKFAQAGAGILKRSLSPHTDISHFDKISSKAINNDISMGDIIVNGNCNERTLSDIRRAQRENMTNFIKMFGSLNK